MNLDRFNTTVLAWPATALLVLLLFAPAVAAVELFGIDLAQATRDQLRGAVKNTGVRLVREAGDDEFFDTYEAQDLLPGARHLYLGFTKQDRRFAFAEYRFKGLEQPELLRRLKLKYGEPQPSRSQFMSDYHLRWRDGPIHISLYSDWGSYATRLVYFEPQRLAVLRSERKGFLTAIDKTQEFLAPAY